MGKKNRLSRDQKRKAKLAKRAPSQPGPLDLVYQGSKFRKAEYVPLYLNTEVGIYLAYMVSGRTITDRTVEAALSELIQALRHGSLPPLTGDPEMLGSADEPEALVIRSIRTQWQEYFDDHPHPGTDVLIGVLRTTLGSIDTWSTPSKQSRGYLNYLKGFLKQAGYQFETPDTVSEGTDAERDLLEWGREWAITCDANAETQFRQLADAMLKRGQNEQVAEVCQELIGEFGSEPVGQEFSAIALRGQRAMLPGPQGK